MKGGWPLAAIVILAAAGCAPAVRVPPLDPLPKDHVVLRDVRYVSQTNDHDCGPACLATMLRHRGSRLTLEQLKDQMKPAPSGGVNKVEMLCAARKEGFRVRMYDGGINDLRRQLLARRPLILMLHPTPEAARLFGARTGHYVVAVGYDDRRRLAVIHSGRQAFATIPYRRLQLQWSRTRFFTLLIEE